MRRQTRERVKDRTEDQRQQGGRGQDEGQGDHLGGDVVGDVGMDGMHGPQEREGQAALTHPVLVLVHDPRVGGVVDQHQHDEVGGEVRRRRIPRRPPPCARETADHTTR